jgi:hypothetical protein
MRIWGCVDYLCLHLLEQEGLVDGCWLNRSLSIGIVLFGPQPQPK